MQTLEVWTNFTGYYTTADYHYRTQKRSGRYSPQSLSLQSPLVCGKLVCIVNNGSFLLIQTLEVQTNFTVDFSIVDYHCCSQKRYGKDSPQSISLQSPLVCGKLVCIVASGSILPM
jgi:hypothetical protein